MTKIAVIKTGGKQYIVTEGQELKVEKLAHEDGQSIDIAQILLTAEGDQIQIGKPFLAQAKVKALVETTDRGKKIRVVKYKAKTRYHKVQGHRQPYTKIKIEKIS